MEFSQNIYDDLDFQPKTPRDRRFSSITDEERHEIQGEFIGLDKNGKYNLQIPTAKLKNLLLSMRIKLVLTDDEINRALKQIDHDEDGWTHVGELNRVIEKYDADGIIYKALSEHRKIRKEFEKHDQDNSGFIRNDALVQIVEERLGILISDRQLMEMTRDVSKTDKGFIDYEGFTCLMTKSFMQKRIMSGSPRGSIQVDSFDEVFEAQPKKILRVFKKIE